MSKAGEVRCMSRSNGSFQQSSMKVTAFSFEEMYDTDSSLSDWKT